MNWKLFGLLLFVALAVAYHFDLILHRGPPRSAGTRSAPERISDREPAFTEPFTCDGRTRCSQMRSCAEAKFFLAHCPGTKMDGDSDGVPCESQWCGADAE